MVKLYSKPGCTMCVASKRRLERKSIPYTEIDVTKNEEAYQYIASLGIMQMPVLETIDSRWTGYQEEKIDALAA